MNKTNAKKLKRTRRHARVRSQVQGTAERPRLAVFRSNKFFYGQIIDDIKGHTLVAVKDADVKGANKTERATKAGELIAEKAKKANITDVVFDRGGFLFTGRVKAFADGARSGGLNF